MKTKTTYATFSRANFDLEKITQFNPALIYGFDPEASAFPDTVTIETVEYCIHSAGQHLDVYNAYLHAQNFILPEIEKTGISNITSKQVLDWIDQIHSYIAATLASEFKGKKQGIFAGQPSKTQILRYQQGLNVKAILAFYLSDLLPPESDVIQLLKEEGINEEFARPFIQLLLRIRDDERIEIPDYQKSYMDYGSSFEKNNVTIAKLGGLYHNGLSENEKKIVNNVVKICTSPTKISEVRDKFAEDFLEKLRTCDRSDVNSVAEFAFFTFYRLTEEHWYFNANGRTATCFVNIFLRAFGYPSILIRNPNERDDLSSSYSQAIKKIDTQPELFLNHIRTRIQEAKELQNCFEDKKLAEIISIRVKLGKLFYDIKLQFPEYKINDYYAGLVNKLTSSNQFHDKNDYIIFSLCGLLNSFETLLNTLQKDKQETQKVTMSPVLLKDYTAIQKEDILKKLTSLSGKSGWKAYKTNGLTVLLEVEDKSFATQLINSLNQTQTLKAQIKINPSTKNSVVYIDSINYEKLMTVSSLENFVVLDKINPETVISFKS